MNRDAMRFAVVVLHLASVVQALTLQNGPGKAAAAASFRARQLKLIPTQQVQQQQKKKSNNARTAELRMMSDTDDMSSTDPNFSGDELSRTWERTGKGKKRWAPGDETGDIAMDRRLLYSNWVLNPMSLRVKDGCSQSAAANLVLGWLKLPYKAVVGEKSLQLTGSGVPGGEGGLATYGEITSFAFAVAKPSDGISVAPATGRADVAAWLEAPSVASFRPLLRGRQPDDGIPCLNGWGISMDDATVLPVLKVLLSASDADDEGLLDVRDYVAYNFAKAGVEL